MKEEGLDSSSVDQIFKIRSKFWFLGLQNLPIFQNFRFFYENDTILFRYFGVRMLQIDPKTHFIKCRGESGENFGQTLTLGGSTLTLGGRTKRGETVKRWHNPVHMYVKRTGMKFEVDQKSGGCGSN